MQRLLSVAAGNSTSNGSAAALRLVYGSEAGAELETLSNKLGLIGGPAYRVPRTAYKGVVSFRRAGVLVHLCPADYVPQ